MIKASRPPTTKHNTMCQTWTPRGTLCCEKSMGPPYPTCGARASLAHLRDSETHCKNRACRRRVSLHVTLSTNRTLQTKRNLKFKQKHTFPTFHHFHNIFFLYPKSWTHMFVGGRGWNPPFIVLVDGGGSLCPHLSNRLTGRES